MSDHESGTRPPGLDWALLLGRMRFVDGLSGRTIVRKLAITGSDYAQCMSWLRSHSGTVLPAYCELHGYRESIEAYADGLIDVAKAREVLDHTDECEDCQTYLVDLVAGTTNFVREQCDATDNPAEKPRRHAMMSVPAEYLLDRYRAPASDRSRHRADAAGAGEPAPADPPGQPRMPHFRPGWALGLLGLAGLGSAQAITALDGQTAPAVHRASTGGGVLDRPASDAGDRRDRLPAHTAPATHHHEPDVGARVGHHAAAPAAVPAKVPAAPVTVAPAVAAAAPVARPAHSIPASVTHAPISAAVHATPHRVPARPVSPAADRPHAPAAAAQPAAANAAPSSHVSARALTDIGPDATHSAAEALTRAVNEKLAQVKAQIASQLAQLQEHQEHQEVAEPEPPTQPDQPDSPNPPTPPEPDTEVPSS